MNGVSRMEFKVPSDEQREFSRVAENLLRTIRGIKFDGIEVKSGEPVVCFKSPPDADPAIFIEVQTSVSHAWKIYVRNDGYRPRINDDKSLFQVNCGDTDLLKSSIREVINPMGPPAPNPKKSIPPSFPALG